MKRILAVTGTHYLCSCRNGDGYRSLNSELVLVGIEVPLRSFLLGCHLFYGSVPNWGPVVAWRPMSCTLSLLVYCDLLLRGTGIGRVILYK